MTGPLIEVDLDQVVEINVEYIETEEEEKIETKTGNVVSIEKEMCLEQKNCLFIDPSVFENMKTSGGIALGDISKSMRVLLFFTSSVGCMFCKGTMNDIYSLQEELLKLNCIPVIAHEEDNKTYEKCLNSHKTTQKFLSILHMERKPFVEYFKLQHFGRLSETAAWLKRGIIEASRLAKLGMKNEPSYFKNGIHYLKNDFFSLDTDTVLAACFVVENKKIISEYRKEHKYQRFDVAKIVVDSDGIGIEVQNIFDCDYPKTPRKTKSIETIEKKPRRSSSLRPTSTSPFLKRVFSAKSVSNSPNGKTKRNSNRSDFFSFSSKSNSDSDDDTIKEFFSNSFHARARRFSQMSEEAPPVDLAKVLTDPTSMKFFKLFATQEHSVENLIFYEEVQKYRVLNDEKRASRAEQIMKIFFASDSIYEISASRKHLIELQKKRENGDSSCDLFDPVLREVVNMNLSDTFQRYKLSELFVEMQQNKKKSYFLFQ
eukprot:gene2738-4147_t